jgi:hypothetical protein
MVIPLDSSEIDSFESIPGLLKNLKTRALLFFPAAWICYLEIFVRFVVLLATVKIVLLFFAAGYKYLNNFDIFSAKVWLCCGLRVD